MSRPAGDRVTGAVLYGAAALLLALGGMWWIRSSPEQVRLDAELGRWRDTIEELVPERDDAVAGSTVVLDGAGERSYGTDVRAGSYLLTVACAGRGQVRVRAVSADGGGSSRPLGCTESPRPFTVPVGLDGTFQIEVAASTDDRAVFRWQLRPTPP